jgi:hypothetical protein
MLRTAAPAIRLFHFVDLGWLFWAIPFVFRPSVTW